METTIKKPLTGLTLEQLRNVAAECGMPSFAAKQMSQWLYEKRVTSIDEMTNLSKSARQCLSTDYCIGVTPPRAAAESTDGSATALLDGYRGQVT